MKRDYSGILLNAGIYALIFFAAICVLVFLKWGAVSSSGLILDDMQLYYPSVYTELGSRSLYLKVYSFINTTLYQPNLVRLFYIVLMAFIAVLMYSLLLKVTPDKLSAALVALLATFTPTSAVVGLFINGSYNVLFLLFFLVGLVGQCCLFSRYPSLTAWQRVSIHMASTFSIALAVHFTSNGILLPLTLMFLPWWRSKLYLHHKRRFFAYVITFALISLGSMAWKIVTTLDHPYAHMEGRLNYELGALVLRAVELTANIFNSYFVNYLSTGVLYDLNVQTVGFWVVACLSLATVVVALMVPLSRSVRTFFSERMIILLAGFFLVVTLILCVGPLTPNTRLHLWHYYLPATTIALMVGLVTSTIFPRGLFLGVVTLLLGVSILRLSEQLTYYDATFAGQEKLISQLEMMSPDWPTGSSVVIATDYIPFMSGFGQLNGLRDLNFLKFHYPDKNVRYAAIATPARIRSILQKKNILSTPTQLYRFSYSSGRIKALGLLVVESEGAHFAYDTTKLKPLLVASGSGEEVEQYLEENEFFSEDYVYLRSGELLPGVDYRGESVSLNGEEEIVRDVDLAGVLSKFSYEILLKSHFDGCVEFDAEQQRCPSMALLMPPLAIYQPSLGNYMIQVKASGSDKYVRFKFDQEQWQKIRFSFDLDEETLAIYLNNQLLDTLDGVNLAPGSVKTVQLGKGYNQRYWKGEIGNFTIRGLTAEGRAKLFELKSSTTEVE